MVATSALACGRDVLFNSNPYDQWDLLIDMKRYQVKLAYQRSDRKKRGSLYVDVIRTTKWKPYMIGAADFLAVVVPGEIWVIPWAYVFDAGRTTAYKLWDKHKEYTQVWTAPFQSTT